MSKSGFVRALCAAAFAVSLGSPLLADNQWSNYHWARTSNPFTLTVVNSLTSDWDPYAVTAVTDWSQSQVLSMTQNLNGSIDDRDRRRCGVITGQVHICNMTFGFNGWLGIAGISIDNDGHIFTGYVKLNDTYFDTSYYNTFEWKQSVVCQELGHVVGLDHQDEVFDNEPLGTCMDYQDPPTTHPDQHDYAELENIYEHLDSFNSYITEGGGGGGGGTCNAPPGKGCNKVGVPQGENRGEWGISLGRRGAKEQFLRIDPDGTRHVTFVTWAQGR